MAGRLRFGLIGCGEIAVATAQAIRESANACVVACTDPKRSLAEDLAATCAARVADSQEDLLREPGVDAVIISTPHHLHEPIAVAAMKAGKHCLTEKPIACTLTQADHMIETAIETGRALSVFYPVRYSFSVTRARELVAAGAIGRPVACKMHMMMRKKDSYWQGGYSGRAASDWRTSKEKSGGGVLIMNISHSIDSLLSILDPVEPERIYSEYDTFLTDVEVEDFISFILRMKGGLIMTADASSAAIGGEGLGDRIYGEKGQLALVSHTQLRVHLAEPHGGIEAGKWVTFDAPPDYANARAQFVDAFSRAVLAGTPPPLANREARRTLEIVRGAYLSMQRGRLLSFPIQE